MDRLAWLVPLVSLLAASLVSCNKTSSPQTKPAASDEPSGPTKSTPEDASEDPSPARTPRRGRWKSGAATRLVAVAHSLDDERARTIPIELGSTMTVGSSRSWAARPIPNIDQYRFVVAHGGGSRLAVVQPGSPGYDLVWADLSGDDEDERIGVGSEAPAGMIVHGQTVMLGVGTTLLEVSFHDEEPEPARIHAREARGRKAYDLFASAGNWLVAIDDMVAPYLADSFRLDGSGRANHTAGFSLPGLINGTFERARLHREDGQDGTLYMLVQFGILDGYGQQLNAISMKAGESTLDEEVILNDGSRSDGREEFMERATKRPVRLAAGSKMTDWTGLAIVERDGAVAKILVAASERGLFVFPPEFDAETPATVVDLGAPCRDVVTVGESAYALIDGAVVQLGLEDGRMQERTRAELAPGFRRWAM